MSRSVECVELIIFIKRLWSKASGSGKISHAWHAFAVSIFRGSNCLEMKKETEIKNSDADIRSQI